MKKEILFMKKIISAILITLILMTSISALAVGEPNPSGNSVETTKDDLENVIKLAKSLLPIPESFNKFEYHMANMGEREIWNLSWNSETQDGSANASIDSNGNIINYYMYKREEYDGTKKLPKISRAEAEKIADDFVKKVAPQYISIIQKEDNDQASSSERYSIRYFEVHNSIIFDEGGITLEISPKTGEIVNYNCSINPENEFVKTEKIITVEQAKQVYKTEIGMKLIYKSTFEDEKLSTYLAYVPKYDQEFALDAFTGKRIQLNYYGMPYYGVAREEMLKSSKGMADIVLTPEEIDAVKDLSGLLTKAEAEKKARAIGKELGLTSAYTLQSSSLQRAYPIKEKFNWDFSFILTDKKNGESYFSISFDAKTGEIVRYYANTYSLSSKAPEAKYGIKEAKTAADAFIKKYASQKAGSFEYVEQINEPNPKMVAQQPQQISLFYNRVINGIPFPDNNISIEYDAVEGKITSYNLGWYDIEFKEPKDIIPADKINENFLNKVGLELRYKSSYAESDMLSIKMNDKWEVKLVYLAQQGMPTTLNPYTGELMDYNGKPYKEVAKIEYTDIAGHYAENQITAIGQIGIGFSEKEYKPDLVMLQKDFLWLLSKTSNSYDSPLINGVADKKEIDDMYKSLMSRGIIKDGEVAPEAQVNRADAVKFVIRALKLEDIASISDIWNCPFIDKDTFGAGNIGYITLAYGMGIIKGDTEMNFAPKLTLTRGQAAIIIYNFLNRK
jgi:hypothetical protein